MNVTYLFILRGTLIETEAMLSSVVGSVALAHPTLSN